MRVRMGTLLPVLTAALAVLLFAAGAAMPADAEITKVFVIPLSHLDIGFTGPPDEVAAQHSDYVARVLRFAANVEDLRWNVESVWQLEQWLDAHTRPEEREPLRDALLSGKIAVGASYANMHSSLMTGEDLLRMFYPAERLREAYGIAVEAAVMNDVPGFAWYVPQAMAEAGVKYLVAGVNTGFGGGASIPPSNMPFFWQGPDGSRVLTWVSPEGYLEGSFYWKLNQASTYTLKERLRELEASGYPYDAVLVLDGYGDNGPPDPVILRQQTFERWSRPGFEVKNSTPEAFFGYLEETYGDRFPVYSGDWGRSWEVTRTAGPWQMAELRRAQSEVGAIETLATLASHYAGVSYPAELFEKAWRNLLVLLEHSSGPGTGWPDLTTKAQVERENVIKAQYTEDLRDVLDETLDAVLPPLASALGRGGDVEVDATVDTGSLGGAVDRDKGIILVYNPVSWERDTDVAWSVEQLREALPELDVSGTLPPLEVVDPRTGASLPVVQDQDGLRLRARDLPPIGFRSYVVRPAQRGAGAAEPIRSAAASSAGQETGTGTREPIDAGRMTLESPWYRAEFDRETGLIRSLYDKEAGRELRNGASRYGFNQLLVAPHRVAFLGGAPKPLHSTVSSVSRWDDPWSVGLRIAYAADTPFAESEIRLSLLEKRVEITNVLDRSRMRIVPYQEHSDHYYFAFPFALPARGLKARYQGAAHMQAVQESLPGANQESIITLGAIDLRAGDAWGVTTASREAFAFTVGGIGHLGVRFAPREATLFSHAVQKIDEGKTKDLGIQRFDVEPGAPRELTFSYALTSGQSSYDPVATLRFGRAWTVPAISAATRGKALEPRSFVSVDSPQVVVTALKRAEFEDGRDFILRLQEVSGEEAEVTVRTAFDIVRAERASGVEQPVGGELPTNPIRLSVWPYETVTIRLTPSAPGP